MIKPSDVRFSQYSRTGLSETMVAQCESDFDEAIRKAESAGRWPAIVRTARDGMLTAVVDHVAAQYRAAGWTVDIPTDRRHDVRASIYLPSDHQDLESGDIAV